MAEEGAFSGEMRTRKGRSDLGLGWTLLESKALKREHVREEALVMIGCLGPGA